MRVVLDTNILARAVPGQRGPAREVLECGIRVLNELELLVELRP